MIKMIGGFKFRTKVLPAAVAMTAVVTLAGAASLANDGGAISTAGTAKPESAIAGTAAETHIKVACALPGQIRKLGRSVTYLAPSRIVRIEHSACTIRGGRPLSG